MISNIETAHNFANNYKESQRSGNMFWHTNHNGTRSIYSYGHHFEIACIDGNTCYFTTRAYSNTTAKHISDVRFATSQYSIVFCAFPSGTVNDNMRDFEERCANVLPQLARARKPEKYLSELAYIVRQAQKYATAKGVDLSDKMQNFATFKGVESAEVKSLKEQQAKERKDNAERVQRWCDGENIRLSFDILEKNVPIRVTAHKGYNIIETAKGVKIAMNEAVRFARELLAGNIQTGWNASQIGNYKVRTFDANVVQIGCHTFKRSYLDTWANKVVTEYA